MILHPVGVPPDVDDVAVVHEAVDEGGRHHLIGKALGRDRACQGLAVCPIAPRSIGDAELIARTLEEPPPPYGGAGRHSPCLPAAVPEHLNFKLALNRIGDTHVRYLFRQKNDADKDLYLAVQAFCIPK